MHSQGLTNLLVFSLARIGHSHRSLFEERDPEVRLTFRSDPDPRISQFRRRELHWDLWFKGRSVNTEVVLHHLHDFVAPAEEMDALDLPRKRLIKDRKEHRPIEVSQ